MTKIFNHPFQGKAAAKHLLILHQGPLSVAEFRTLATGLGWNDESLQVVFLNGLSEQVKHELAAR